MTAASEYEAEMERHTALSNSLRAALPERALRSRVSPDLLRPWLDAHIRSDETLRQGRIVTDLVRLGNAIWPACATLLKGGTDVDTERLIADARGPYGLHVILRNVTKKTIAIETHARRITIKANDIGEATRWVDRPQRTEVEPEGVIDLSLHYAVVALRAHGWRAYPPEYWESSSALLQRDEMIEVGYACDSLGIDSRRSGEQKRKAS